jgi:hypothetical protein
LSFSLSFFVYSSSLFVFKLFRHFVPSSSSHLCLFYPLPPKGGSVNRQINTESTEYFMPKVSKSLRLLVLYVPSSLHPFVPSSLHPFVPSSLRLFVPSDPSPTSPAVIASPASAGRSNPSLRVPLRRGEAIFLPSLPSSYPVLPEEPCKGKCGAEYGDHGHEAGC